MRRVAYILLLCGMYSGYHPSSTLLLMGGHTLCPLSPFLASSSCFELETLLGENRQGGRGWGTNPKKNSLGETVQSGQD